MSHTPPIGNEEPLFQFDSYEAPADGNVLEHTTSFIHTAPIDAMDITHHLSPFALSSSDPDPLDRTIPRDMDGQDIFDVPEVGKGKGVSEPMAIRPQVVVDTHDTFDTGSSGVNYAPNEAQPSTSYTFPSPPPSSSCDLQYIQPSIDDICQRFSQEDPIPIPGSSFDHESQIASGSLSNKGKEKELAPVLPPLQFSPTEFGYSNADWPSPALNASTSGPSSYGSGYGSIIESNIHLTTDRGSPQSPPILRRMPSRRRSFSHLSIRSTRSMATLSMFPSKIKFGTSKMPGNLARRLLFRSRAGSSSSSPSHTPGAATPRGSLIDGDFSVGQGSCLMPWRNEFKSQMKGVPPSIPYLSLEAELDDQTLPVYHRNKIDLKGKGRSYSSPLPASALDIIPSVSTDIFTPIPIVPRNYFDDSLPKELQLEILSSLIALHEADHERSLREGEWTVLRASSSKHRWVGKDKGIRELVKLSRVSKSWQVLVFDGQMWSNMDLRAFPRIPPSLLTRLSRSAGTFVKSVDASGHTTLLPSTLLDVTNDLCLKHVPSGQLPHTQLTSINFQGCAALTTRSLHHLLIRSPSLQTICLKGLTAVTNTTCDVLGVYCAQVTVLDIGRCLNVDGHGIRSFISAGLNRGNHLPLKELRASGLKRVNDEVLATLGKGAPFLEVLDLSYARDLHNSALEAFVSCANNDTQFKTVLLSAREAGRELGDTTKYRRRVTRLRHLSLSSCVLLTDIACSNLAHTMPRLEYLELAGIGTELKDDGLIRLLRTTPLIRRLDLEDASDITDALIATITPRPVADTTSSGSIDPSEPGHALERLVLSYAGNITDEAFLSLIQNCTRLSVLEADNTRMSGSVLKEFVRLSRIRKIVNPVIVAIDCRGVGESIVKELNISTRPRKGWRSYEARKLGYVDGRDKEDLKVGRDECDEMRVVLKSFYSWQTVDAVRAARDKRKKTKRITTNEPNGNTSDSDDRLSSSGRARWWSPSGRRSSGTTSPTIFDASNDRDQCRIM